MLAVEKDLMDMLVRELKEELAARNEPVSGNNAWLRRPGNCTRRLCVCLEEGVAEGF